MRVALTQTAGVSSTNSPGGARTASAAICVFAPSPWRKRDNGVAVVGAAEVELVHGAAVGRGDELAVGGAVRSALEHRDRAGAVLFDLPGGRQRAVVGARQHGIAGGRAEAVVEAHGAAATVGFGAGGVEALHARAEADVEVALGVDGHAQRPDRPGGPFGAPAIDDPRGREGRAVGVERGGDLRDEHARAREAGAGGRLLAVGDGALAEAVDVERELVGGAVQGMPFVRRRG